MPRETIRAAVDAATRAAIPAATGSIPDATGSAADGEEGGEGKPEFVTKADLESIVGKLTSDFKAEIGRLRKAKPEPLLKTGESAEGEDDADPGKGKESWHKTVATKVQELEAEREIVRNGARRNKIRDALVSAGADSVLAGAVVSDILANDGDSFKVEMNRISGEHLVTYQDGALSDWAKLFVSTELGKRILPSTPVPSMSGIPGSKSTAQRGGKIVPASQAHTLSDEQLRSGEYSIVPG